jgi:hypothetical protein
MWYLFMTLTLYELHIMLFDECFNITVSLSVNVGNLRISELFAQV